MEKKKIIGTAHPHLPLFPSSPLYGMQQQE